MLEGYWHIVRYKHWRYQGGLLMTSYTSMYTKNQNEDGNNHRSLWQGEWNQLLAFVLCKIVFCLEQQLLLHALSLSKHAAPNLYRLDQQWQHSPQFENCLRWWQYLLIPMYSRGKGGKSPYVHELHSPMQWLQQYIETYHGL
jgi:hypothetical protein